MDTTNKKTCAFLLDRDVAAAVDQAAADQRISKSAVVNGILARALISAEMVLPPPAKPGPKPKPGPKAKRQR